MNGRILVMDDETVIRDVAGEMLQMQGFEVICSQNGEEALNLFIEARTHGRPFDLVLLDLTIPGGMGGEAVVERLREVDLAVVAIVASGYADNSVMAHPHRYGFADKIEKPFRKSELAAVVARALRLGAEPG
jgi:DNA-binding NtrC family response regulator